MTVTFADCIAWSAIQCARDNDWGDYDDDVACWANRHQAEWHTVLSVVRRECGLPPLWGHRGETFLGRLFGAP